jgi:hypothetical protein
MITSLVRVFFGCRHSRTTFPQTGAEGMVVACLDCGQQFTYDWDNMRIGEALPPNPGTDGTFSTVTKTRV